MSADRRPPRGWSLLLSTISIATFTVLLVTGVILMFFYEPSTETVVYRGSHRPLQGVEMSRALSSLLHLSLDVRGGLLVRQAHHWAALILPASLMLQMLTTYFTGRFTRPRHWSWVLLCLVFLLILGLGWSGYALPDDTLSGTGLRIMQGIVIGIPAIGTTLNFLLFDGEFPGPIITRLYWLHVLVLPIALLVVVAVRARIDSSSQGARSVVGRGVRTSIAGLLRSPTALIRAGMFSITIGVIVLMAGTMTISPIWHSGPSSTSRASAGSQPDWYTGFLDGALRLAPSGLEIEWLGGTWPVGVLLPQAVAIGFLATVTLLPFFHRRTNRSAAIQYRPRNAPTRTAVGVAGLVFYVVLWAAGSADIIATRFHISFERQIGVLQVALILGPLIAFYLTRHICLALQAHDAEVAEHGVETGQIRRLPEGGFVEQRTPVSNAERQRLLGWSRADEPDDGTRRAS